MKYFIDATCLQELNTLDLGEILAGEIKREVIYVKNDTKAHVRNIKVEAIGVELLSYPLMLAPNEVKQIIIIWNSTLEIKEPIKAKLIISSEEVY